MPKRKKTQKDKQLSTNHYAENQRSNNTNPTKTGDEPMCSGKVSSSCSITGTRRATLVRNPVISHE